MSGFPVRDCRCPRARHRHGTRQAYSVDRCRCFACRVANAQRKADYLAGRKFTTEQLIDATSTRLRLRALAAVGISRQTIAADLGISDREVQYLRNTRTVVQVGTALRVAEVYDRRWNDWPTGRAASLTRAQARRHGWRPPMDLDDDELRIIKRTGDECVHNTTGMHGKQIGGIFDEIAVERAIDGRRVALTRREMSTAVATMTRMGYSAAQIAERLRITERSVTRNRTKGRAA